MAPAAFGRVLGCQSRLCFPVAVLLVAALLAQRGATVAALTCSKDCWLPSEAEARFCGTVLDFPVCVEGSNASALSFAASIAYATALGKKAKPSVDNTEYVLAFTARAGNGLVNGTVSLQGPGTGTTALHLTPWLTLLMVVCLTCVCAGGVGRPLADVGSCSGSSSATAGSPFAKSAASTPCCAKATAWMSSTAAPKPASLSH
jgi:hypothetical protein